MTVERIPIGTFSRVTRLTQRALRLYDERGLLVPAGKDVCTGYRSYTTDQIGRGVTIGHLVSLGFGLAEVEALLDARAAGDRETIRRLFAARREAIGAESRRLAAIDAALARGGADPEVFAMSISEPTSRRSRLCASSRAGARARTARRSPRMIGEVCAALAPRNGREPAFTRRRADHDDLPRQRIPRAGRGPRGRAPRHGPGRGRGSGPRTPDPARDPRGLGRLHRAVPGGLLGPPGGLRGGAAPSGSSGTGRRASRT